MYELIYSKGCFKIYRDQIPNIIQLRINADMVHLKEDLRVQIKNERHCKSLHPSIEEYRFVSTSNDIDKYYVACKSPHPYFAINPMDMFVNIKFDRDVIIFSSDDTSPPSDIYERITKFNMTIQSKENGIEAELTYHSRNPIIDFMAIFNLINQIIDSI